MTDINKINPKPIETVYEIKEENQIPSFEEFMKDYKVDGNLNYDDLSGGSVGESKGYGPCVNKNSNCSCDCPRSDCNCIYDGGCERWCNLRLACPICPRGGDNYIRS